MRDLNHTICYEGEILYRFYILDSRAVGSHAGPIIQCPQAATEELPVSTS